MPEIRVQSFYDEYAVRIAKQSLAVELKIYGQEVDEIARKSLSKAERQYGVYEPFFAIPLSGGRVQVMFAIKDEEHPEMPFDSVDKEFKDPRTIEKIEKYKKLLDLRQAMEKEGEELQRAVAEFSKMKEGLCKPETREVTFYDEDEKREALQLLRSKLADANLEVMTIAQSALSRKDKEEMLGEPSITPFSGGVINVWWLCKEPTSWTEYEEYSVSNSRVLEFTDPRDVEKIEKYKKLLALRQAMEKEVEVQQKAIAELLAMKMAPR